MHADACGFRELIFVCQVLPPTLGSRLSAGSGAIVAAIVVVVIILVALVLILLKMYNRYRMPRTACFLPERSSPTPGAEC